MEFGKTLENHYKPYFCGFCAKKIVMEIAKTTRNHSKLVGRESESGGFRPAKSALRKLQKKQQQKTCIPRKKLLTLQFTVMIGCSHKEVSDMTIKEFSQLCGCTAQTLRYYDSINLLKPARTDCFTGYRYYDSEQALDYVKIKTLQEALFSIEEIKELLKKDDDAIAKAIDGKIAEQTEKLETLVRIRQSYRKEYMKMQEVIQKTKDKINESVGRYDATKEYGISEECYRAIIEEMNEQYEQAIANSKAFEGPDISEEEFKKTGFEVRNGAADNPLEDVNNIIIAEQSGWKYTEEVLKNLPPLDGDCTLYFELDDEKWNYNDFCIVVIKIVQSRNQGKDFRLSCTRNRSTDGVNRFWLLKK